MNLQKKLDRLRWLFRRLSRISPAEIPYRIQSQLRIALQKRGLLDARRLPQSTEPRYGKPWVFLPRLGPDQAAEYLDTVESLRTSGLPIFDMKLPIDPAAVEWNSDPRTGRKIGLQFGLSIDFRAVEGGVDIKYLWELNRHLWWVELAQAHAVSGEPRYLQALGQSLDSWLRACPYPLGPNWSSPVEHGIRLINWSLAWHLIGGAASPLFQGAEGQVLLERWRASIYQHMRFASDNYSLHSSANNHLLGEAAGIFVAAQTWDCWAEGRRLGRQAREILEREAQRQFSADGVNLEQASSYHRFSLQFLLAAGLAARAAGEDFSPAYWQLIEAATAVMASMMDASGQVPHFGDSDDGDVFRLWSGRHCNSNEALLGIGAALFGRGDLRAKLLQVNPQADSYRSWLVRGEPPAPDPAGLARLPQLFPQGGYAILGTGLNTPEEFRVTVDCGPLGYNRIAGHGHADALSVLLSWGGEQLLVDPGTYCYNTAREWRQYFRGSSAHNTLVVDGQDQAVFGASFLWLSEINTRIVEHQAGRLIHACHDGYRRLADPVLHHRRVSVDEASGQLLVEDWLECRKPHEVELLWHAASGCRLDPDEAPAQSWLLQGRTHALRIELSGADLQARAIEGQDAPPQGWVSPGFYRKVPAPVLSVKARLAPGQVLRTRIRRSQSPG